MQDGIHTIWSLIGRLHSGQCGQDALEYLLATAAIVVVLVTALIIGFEVLVPQVVGLICPSVDTADPARAIGSCITNLP